MSVSVLLGGNSVNQGTHIDTPLSVNHHCYSVVPGKVDRKIYERLLLDGMYRGAWTARADIEALTKLHGGDEAYTLARLGRLKELKLIYDVCKIRGGFIFLIPALKDFVPKLRGGNRGRPRFLLEKKERQYEPS